MATDVERLAVLIEANTKSYENAMKKLQQQTDSAMKNVEGRFGSASKRLEATFAGVGTGLNRALGALGLGVGARELQRFADQFTAIQNALRVTGLEGDKLNEVYGRLFQSAQKNAAPLQSLATLYGRAALNQNELKVSTEELLQFTDRVALALRVSGQSAEQSSGALLQLSQALGSGVVRAEEFNSILEGAPTIAQAAAAGIEEAGGSVAKLRGMVVDGKISSEAFFRGFQAGSVILEQRAGSMEKTVGQAITQLNNSFIDAVGRINDVTGASRQLVSVADDLARGLSWVASNVDQAKGPYAELSKVLHGAATEAKGLAGWLETLARLNVPGNIGRYIGQQIRSVDRLSPALPAPSGSMDEAGFSGLAQSSAAPSAAVPLPRSRPQQTSTIRAGDYPVNTGGGSSRGGGSKTLGVDSFERAIAAAEKNIAIMKAETAMIDESVAARERARVIVELETAARAANNAEGLANTEITDEQRAKIDEMAGSMYGAAEAAEYAASPLATAAREAGNLALRFEEAAVMGADALGDTLADIVTGAATAEEAFKKFAMSVIRDLTAMIAKALIFKAIKLSFGVLFADGGPVAGMAGGGPVMGPGSGRSDSIPARLSNGEYVVNAEATRRNRELLDAINFGALRPQRFSDGGRAGGPGSPTGGAPSAGPQDIYMTVSGESMSIAKVRQIADGLNELCANGYRLKIAPA